MDIEDKRLRILKESCSKCGGKMSTLLIDHTIQKKCYACGIELTYIWSEDKKDWMKFKEQGNES